MALWLVATPIGTLGDGSPRAREVLGSAAVICCEDTRETRRLLSAWSIPAPRLEALHAHNEDRRAEELAALARGVEVALVSDAGTPGVSDPGRALVRACHAAGVEVRSVPGPSALAAALAASGLPATPSTFLGFAPHKGRAGWIEDALARPETLVIFEAPGRLPRLLEALAARSPAREAVVCRELSKKFEEVRLDTLSGLAERFRDGVRGECVLVIGPGAAVTPAAVEAPPAEDAGLKEIASALAARWGRPRREIYQALLALQGDAPS